MREVAHSTDRRCGQGAPLNERWENCISGCTDRLMACALDRECAPLQGRAPDIHRRKCRRRVQRLRSVSQLSCAAASSRGTRTFTSPRRANLRARPVRRAASRARKHPLRAHCARGDGGRRERTGRACDRPRRRIGAARFTARIARFGARARRRMTRIRALAGGQFFRRWGFARCYSVC